MEGCVAKLSLAGRSETTERARFGSFWLLEQEAVFHLRHRVYHIFWTMASNAAVMTWPSRFICTHRR